MTDDVLIEENVMIDADRESVFDLLTTACGLLRWIAVDVQCEATPGGVLRWRHENGALMSGRFVTVDRPSRVVFTYGWESGGPDIPPGSTRVEITLEERDRVTHLRLLHLLPTHVAKPHREGWRWFLGRLRDGGAGANVSSGCHLENRGSDGP